MRWDFLSHPYEAHNQQSAFDVATGTVLLAGQNGVSDSILNQDYHSFGPRLGFAYDLFGNGRTVVRGGYGIFYFLDYGGINNQLGEQPPFGGSNDYLATNGYCITFTGQLATSPSPMAWDGGYNCTGYTSPATVVSALPARGYPNFDPAHPPAGTSMIAVNRNNENSMVQEWNLQAERQFGANNVVDVAYVGTRGSNLSTYYPYNLNQFTTGAQNFPGLGGINYNNYNGISNYDGLQIHAEHRASSGLTGTVSYAWSHTLDDSPGAFQSQSAALYYDPMAGYGNSSQDQRQVFSSSILYYLPFGRGKKFAGNISRPMDWLVGGWQTSLIALVQSGTPVDLSTGTAAPGNRPDLVGHINYPKSITGHWFDPTVFGNPPTVTGSVSNATTYTRLGNLGRNQIYGPGYRVVNFSLQKDLHLYERYVLELHGDAFNLFNTAEFTNPNSNLTGGNFGQVQGVQVYSNREIQLAARFHLLIARLSLDSAAVALELPRTSPADLPFVRRCAGNEAIVRSLSSNEQPSENPVRLRPHLFLAFCLFLTTSASWAQVPHPQAPQIDKIDPPGWFAGLPDPMLLVHGAGLNSAQFTLRGQGVTLERTQASENGHWAFLWLQYRRRRAANPVGNSR